MPAQIGAGVITGTSCSVGGSSFEQSIVGCDPTPYQCGGPTALTPVDTSIGDPGTGGGDTQTGVQCLIHAAGPGLSQGQDVLDTDDYVASLGPIQIKAGSSNPLIGAGSPVTTNGLITTSSSIVTIPIFDPASTSLGNVRVIGFLQAFIKYADAVSGPPSQSQVHVVILNVSGCGNVSGSPGPIKGGGVSSVPVRLIHQ